MKTTIASIVLLVTVISTACVHKEPVTGPQRPAAAHSAIGGFWYERAFFSFISFNPDGTVSGRYYQYTLTGTWAATSPDSLAFSASLVEPHPGLTFGWEPTMAAIIHGDTLDLVWPVAKTKDALERRASLPPR